MSKHKSSRNTHPVPIPTTRRITTFDELLMLVESHGLILLEETPGEVDLWSPHTKLPIALRRAVRRYNGELLILMHESDARVCPARRWHYRSWKYNRREKRYICHICAELDRSIMQREIACETAWQAA